MDKRDRVGKGFIIGIVVLAVIILAILALLNGGFSITEGISSGSFISVPTYGYIQCDLSKQGSVTTPASGYTQFSRTAINCNSHTGNTLIQECWVTLKTPSKSSVTYANEVLLYKICDTPDCDYSNSNAIKLRQGFFYASDGEFDKEININLKKGQYLVTAYQASNALVGDVLLLNRGLFKVSYTPYFLYRYDVFSQQNGQMISGTEDCQKGNYLSEKNFLIESVSNAGTNNLRESSLLDMNNLRSRGAIVTYLSNFVQIVPQYSMFDDNTKYCYDKKVYAVEDIKLSGGMIYKVANTQTNAQLYTVECCNTADAVSTSGAGYYCKDFKITKLSDSTDTECSTLNPCPIVGYQSLAGKKVASQTCVSGKCQTNYFTVKCNFATDCPNGYCDIDSANPLNNKCVYPQPQQYCGNGVCEASYNENSETCPSDCDVRTKDMTAIYMLLVFLILVVGVLIIAELKRR